MRITFLGTGTSQGVPVIACSCAVCKSLDPRDKRLRTSVLIESENTTVVIDAGPDFRQQMLRAGVQKLDAVVFTHEHKDHIAGLDDVRAFNFRQKKAMAVYASEAVQTALKRDYHYAFAEKQYPGIPQIELHTIDDAPFKVGELEFEPVKVWHYKLPVLGFRIGSFAYVTDANRIDPEEMEKLRKLDVLVLNALQREPHISHFTLSEAITMMEDLKPERGYFTHLSHLMGRHSEVSAELPEFIRVATDQLVIEV